MNRRTQGVRRIAAAGALLLCMAGCAGFRPSSSPHASAPPGPQGRLVHSDPDLGYAIIDFDIWPAPGDRLRLADGDGITALVEVTERRRGSYMVVNILDGRPRMGDTVSVDAGKENEHAHD